MTTPTQSLFARIRGSAITQKIVFSFIALHVAITLVLITVIPLASGVPLRRLVILVPLWCLGVVVWVILIRAFRTRSAASR